MKTIVYVGEDFYRKSRTAMSSVYTEDGRRYDFGFLQVDLANGEEVMIRQATEVERGMYEQRLARMLEAPHA